MRNALVYIVVLATLAGCGQRGALYLPGEEREDVPPAPRTVPAVPMASPIPPAPAAAGAAETTTEDNGTPRRNRVN